MASEVPRRAHPAVAVAVLEAYFDLHVAVGDPTVDVRSLPSDETHALVPRSPLALRRARMHGGDDRAARDPRRGARNLHRNALPEPPLAAEHARQPPHAAQPRRDPEPQRRGIASSPATDA